MKIKKQLKKISKKILILSLATSIIFTSCFSSKKIEAHATSVAVGLSAYTLYELCLYFGGLAITTLGIGYAYENRDEIAEFGKSVIDSMTSLPSQGWVVGSNTTDGNYVYGTEALQEVQDCEWTVIQGGGQSPKNDNDGDGDKDEDDIAHELNLNGYFLTQAGINLFNEHIKPIYDKWVNKEEDNILTHKYGEADALSFNGQKKNENGMYIGTFSYHVDGNLHGPYFMEASEPLSVYFADYYSGYAYFVCSGYGGYYGSGCNAISRKIPLTSWNTDGYIITDLPVFDSYESRCAALDSGDYSTALNVAKTYRTADWIAEDEAWKGHLEDIATSLRSLQDLTTIAQQLANNTLTTQPSADAYGDMMDNLGTEYAPLTTPINDPIYYPATNTTPTLSPSVLPNYVPNTNPDVGGDGTDTPSGDDSEEVPEIDLDGLLSIFNILFYLIMIIVMLIYLFLSCLAFIVMIFRIPASSSMLPDDMVLGFEHLQTIMIPNTNISIYGFAMALIYLFIIFAVIKLIRLEINDFKFPRSYK